MTEQNPEEPAPQDAHESLEIELEKSKQAHYLLRLYVAGNSMKSTQAILNLRRVCEQHLPGRYQIEVFDILQQPELARTEQIIAVPTLVKVLPLPVRRMIGDLSKTDRILVRLDIF